MQPYILCRVTDRIDVRLESFRHFSCRIKNPRHIERLRDDIPHRAHTVCYRFLRIGKLRGKGVRHGTGRAFCLLGDFVP